MNCKNCDKEIPMNHAQVGGVHMGCEHEYFHEKNVRMIRIRPDADSAFVVVTPMEAEQMMKDLLPFEDGFCAESVMMSRGQIEALPEFEGW